MARKFFFYYLSVLMVLVASGCSKEEADENIIVTLPTVSTYAVSDITSTSAFCGGRVSYDGGAHISARGVCWSTSPDPTISNNKTVNGTGAWGFQSTITKLSANKKYYVRAYATNKAGTAYGETRTFTPFGNTVTDADGNVYTFVTIGTQVWLKENLKTTKYQNGDPIPNPTTDKGWADTFKGAYSNFNHDENFAKTYGRLYNWFAVMDSRNICPVDWHVATDAEWTTMTDFLGGEPIAGGKLKEADTLHWKSPNTGADNSSGFTALPANARSYQGIFSQLNGAIWWTSTNSGPTSSRPFYKYIDYQSGAIMTNKYDNNEGYSVRCIRDN